MGSPTPLGMRVDVRDGIALVALQGELDRTTVDAFTARLLPLEHDGVATIMLDLRDLTFIDSAALKAFLQARRRSHDLSRRLLFVGASQAVRRVLDVTETTFILEEHDPVDTLEAFQRAHPGSFSSPKPEVIQ